MALLNDGHEPLAIKVAANYGGVDFGKDFFLTITNSATISIKIKTANTNQSTFTSK
jgi:hypothetical protein